MPVNKSLTIIDLPALPNISLPVCEHSRLVRKHSLPVCEHSRRVSNVSPPVCKPSRRVSNVSPPVCKQSRRVAIVSPLVVKDSLLAPNLWIFEPERSAAGRANDLSGQVVCFDSVETIDNQALK